MLVLTRKADQAIHIGRDVTVTILRIKGRSVKIGIQAPSGVKVFRGELLDNPPRDRQPVPQAIVPGAEPTLGTGLPTSPDAGPEVSQIAGGLRSETVQGQGTRAHRVTVRGQEPRALRGPHSASAPSGRSRRAPRDHLPSGAPPAPRVGAAILFS